MSDFIVIGGLTGSRKTELVQEFSQHINLEQLANHRGSVFGALPSPQPSQSDFENLVNNCLRIKIQSRKTPILIESEGKLIGKRRLPIIFDKVMNESSMLVINSSINTRVDHIQGEYVEKSIKYYNQLDEREYYAKFSSFLFDALFRIKKRLGSNNYSKAYRLMNEAIKTQFNNNDPADHKIWIEFLLVNYYDPIYDRQIFKNQHRVVYSGNYDSVKSWLVANTNIC